MWSESAHCGEMHASSHKSISISETETPTNPAFHISAINYPKKEQHKSLKYHSFIFPPVTFPASPQASENLWHLLDSFITSQIDLPPLFYFWVSIMLQVTVYTGSQPAGGKSCWFFDKGSFVLNNWSNFKNDASSQTSVRSSSLQVFSSGAFDALLLSRSIATLVLFA